MNGPYKTNKIKKAAFIYLSHGSGRYYISDSLDYSIQRRPQLGLQYLCAVLEKKGIETNIFDQTVSLFDIEELIEKIKNYDLIGFYCSDLHENKVKDYCRKIKERLDMPILIGGPGTLANSTFLDHGCDIVVHGEGEITIQQIVEYYNGKRGISDIKGISYKNNNGYVKALPQDLIRDLDEIPFPDRSKIDINSYYDYFLFGMKRPYMTIVASRGCIHKCTFCNTSQIWGYRYRKRNVDNVLSEIDNAVEKYNIKYISFQDAIFGLNNQWIEEFCEKLIKRPYKIRWMAIFHPFTLQADTKKILRLMCKAGCDTLSFGLQSAHPQILKNVNRDPSEPMSLRKVLKMANRLGFVTDVGYIFGLPGDTKETIQATIDYSLNCGSTLAEFYRLSIFKGSEIEKAYNNKKICGLEEDELRELTEFASRKFYTRPGAILKIAYFIAKHPGWLINVGVHAPSILARIGILNPKFALDKISRR